MRPQRAGPARRPAGFTLIELLMVLGLLAVLTSLTLPSFAEQRDRQRLQSAAEALAADVAEARFAAASRGQPLHLRFVAGTEWCYALATTPGCACGRGAACALKVVDGEQLGGVKLIEARDIRLDPDGTASKLSVTFGSARGERLQVTLTPLGRAWVCSPGPTIARYPRC